jgi:hypothetical protein
MPSAERSRITAWFARHGEATQHLQRVNGTLSLPAEIAVRAITTAMDRWTGEDPTLDDVDIECLDAALRQIPIRDAIWTRVDARAADGHDRVWLYLARRLPSPYDAAPLFLYGWAAFRRGDGARANVAVDRALAADADYSAAALLSAALQRGFRPNGLPLLMPSVDDGRRGGE